MVDEAQDQTGMKRRDSVNDFEEPELDKVTSLDDVHVALQPDALTRAALEPCSGGAFHPGVELT